MWILYFTYLFATTYSAVTLLAAYAVLTMRRSRRPPDAALASVTVLVPCRNEQEDLPRCIASLQALDFPPEKLEILLVDDNSTDQTPAIIAEACTRDARFRTVKTEAHFSDRLRAKARALAVGAQHAKHQWLFILDADATVGPLWARNMLSCANGDTGLIGGLVLTEPRGFVGACEAAVTGWVMPAAAAPTRFGGKPIICGPNMGVLAQMYRDSGGLESMELKVAEDMAFERMATSAGKKSVGYADRDTVAWVAPVPSFVHLISQQRRWLLGGREGDPWMYLAVVVLLGLLCFGYLGLEVATVLYPAKAALCWIAVLTSATLGFAALSIRVRRNLLWLAPVIVLYQSFVWPFVYISCLVWPRVHWRGAGYHVTFTGRSGAGGSV